MLYILVCFLYLSTVEITTRGNQAKVSYNDLRSDLMTSDMRTRTVISLILIFKVNLITGIQSVSINFHAIIVHVHNVIIN